MWCEFTLPNTKPFLVCTLYRPPSAQSEWINLFEEKLSIAQSTGLEIILMGDFNIDCTSCINKKWENLVQLFDLSQLVSEPTRITETTSTLIDHIYTTHQENITECFVAHYAISDHFPVCITRKVNKKISKKDHTTTTFRCFNHFDDSAFLNDLQISLSSFSANSTYIDIDFSRWHNIIIEQLDSHAPVKSKRVKHQRLPAWFTPEISLMQTLRDSSKRQKQWSDYKRYRNKTATLIRSAKRKYFSDSINNSKNSKFIWQHLRSVDNKKTSSNTLPDELIIDDKDITKSENIAIEFNKYFTSISDILNRNSDKTPDIDIGKLQHFTNSKLPGDTFFHIPLITRGQVISFINRLDSTKATGIDGLGPKIIKLAADILSPSITLLINRSIIRGQFPSQLKCAKVFPIFKSGTKTDPSNYRPISILPTISKIFEKHINHHSMGYLNKYMLIHESQSGFRPKHSCQTALIKLIDQWKECIDKGDIVGTLFIDFRKAFDVVDHNILLRKLQIYKFSPNAIRWFQSYLEYRQQALVTDNGLSEYAQVRSGVPQGSILGPTLFLLFINDLPLSLQYCSSDFYADDATFHTHDKDIHTIENRIQSDFNASKPWSTSNKMHIHYQKNILYDNRHSTEVRWHKSFRYQS